MRFYWIHDRVTACARANTTFIGAKPNSTGPIISQSIIQHGTIKTCGMNVYIKAITPAITIIMCL
jgi:hypothetical protein